MSIYRMEPVAINGKTFSLQEVAEEHMPTILSQMRNHYPEAVHVHEFFRMLLRYKKTSPDLQISFLAPGGDYRLGIIFSLVDEKDCYCSIYCDNKQASKAIEEALTSFNPPEREIMLISGLTSIAYPAAKPFIDRKGWSELRGTIYWMPWETARQLKVHLPEGVEIRKLRPEHAEIVDREWIHHFPGSEELVARQIKRNFGLGVFRGEDLLSWAVHFFYGGIGTVQTLKSEKRKGYGKAVVEAIAKELGEMQINPHLHVIKGNSAGEAFFESVGFRAAYESQWAGNNLHD